MTPPGGSGNPDGGQLPQGDGGSQLPPGDGGSQLPPIDGGSLPPSPDGGLSFEVVPSYDSAIVRVGPVAGAADYRVYALPATVTTQSGRERVSGTTLFCAGQRQRNATRPAQPEVMTSIEVAGLTGPTTLVIEAIDRLCPYPGAMGRVHADVTVTNPEVEAAARNTFSIYTEGEIAARYGSLIVNGHGPAATVGQPAPDDPPVVLARAQVQVSPVSTPPAMTFFDGFAGAADQPALVTPVDNAGRTQQGALWQNRNWSIYGYGASNWQAFIDRGQLHTVLADWQQDIFASVTAYPRRAVQLPSGSGYLHVQFEVASDATARRYWWLVLCGGAQAGQTIDANGRINGSIIETPFFYQPDGLSPSVQGWNCLQIFPRDGVPYRLAPNNARPESDVRVMVNRAAAAGTRDNVVDVSPDQYGGATAGAAPSWYRQESGAQLTAPILDDQMLVAPNTRFDFYLQRARVVMFVNGQQRLCNDFPNAALTMAEGALGFGQILYHSAAERIELQQSFNDRTGQVYYLSNSPFVDERRWDNLGYDENAPAPAAFDASQCYVAP